MSSKRPDRTTFDQRNQSKRVLLGLFPNSDTQMFHLIRSCDALHFHVEMAVNQYDLERMIQHFTYDIIFFDTRKQSQSIVSDSLKILTEHTPRSFLIALYSSRIDQNPSSKLTFLLSLLQEGVDRLLRQSNDPIDYVVQLLAIRDIDLPRKQRSQLTAAMSAVLNQWPQTFQIVNEDFQCLYENNRAKTKMNLFNSNQDDVHSRWIQQMKQQLIETRRPWKWKSNKINDSSSILFIPLHLNMKKTTVNTYSFELSEHDRSDSSLNQTRLTHPSRSTRNNRLSHQRRLNKYYIEELRHIRDEKHMQSIIEKITFEFNLKKKITTLNQLIQTLKENHIDVSLLNHYYQSIGLSSQIRHELNRWKTWHFNLIELNSLLGSNTFFHVANEIFSHFNISHVLRCSNETLINWISIIFRNYHDLPYHNGLHGLDVLQAASFYLLNHPCRTIFNEIERAAILISCLCHDIQHSGRTNAYLINTNNHLALLYNDQTVLENHHASVTFRLTLSSNDVNIFSELSSEEFRFIRWLIIDSILVTDISKHFDILRQFSCRNKEIDDSLIKNHSHSKAQIQPMNIESKQINHFKGDVRRMIMKNADLSNATRPQTIAFSWAMRLAEELFQQTEDEKENDLILTNDMFTRETCNLARTQINFYDQFMREMLVEWVDFTQLNILKENFEHNYTFWISDETKHHIDRSQLNK